MISVIKIILYTFFVIISGYFASMETALLRYSAKKINVKDKIKKYLGIWEDNPAVILSSILIGTNCACAGIGVLSNSLNISIIYSTLLLLIFGEILPKIYALTHSEKMINFGIKKLVQFSFFTNPISNLLVKMSSFITGFFLGDKSKESPFLSAEELKELIQQDEIVSKEDRIIYTNVLELTEKRIFEIMIPKDKIVAIDYNQPMENIIKKLSNTKYSRVPVFKGNIDNIVGIIYTKDVTVAIQNRDIVVIDDIIRKPYFVINTAKVFDILKQFKQGHQHLAIVVDEYGATSGLVTIEDIIEEIFGEIYDEYDVRKEKVLSISEGVFVISGDETLKNVNEILKTNFYDDEVVTFSGYIITKLGYIPNKGEKIKFENLELEIIDTNNKIIKKMKVNKIIV